MGNETNAVNDKKTSKLSVILSDGDKKYLKIYAVEHNTSVSAVIHEYVEQLRKAGEDDG